MTLIDQFAAALGVEDVNAITIDSIIIGSVDIEGSAAPTGPPGSAQAALQLQSLTNLLTSGNIAGMQAGLTSLTVPEGDVGQLAVEEE